MRKKASTSEVLTELRTKKFPDRQVPCTPDGMWIDWNHHFITKAPAVSNVFYYRDLTHLYSQYQPNAHLGTYDESKFSRRFADSPLNKDLYPLKESFLNLDPQEMDKAVRAAFQLGSDIEWRCPQPGERIFYRPNDGFVPVWMEHLRSGWNPRSHQFIKHRCKYILKISPMQITPNGIKLMNLFLSCYNKMNFQPTFILFYQLFSLVKSNVKPLYELRFRFTKCGFGSGDAKPVIQQSSLKYWNAELIMLKGLDLFYMSYIATSRVVTNFKPSVLEKRTLRQVFEFYNCLGS